MTTIDAHGNLHDTTGKFAEKPHSAPSGLLAEPRLPESVPVPLFDLDQFDRDDPADVKRVEQARDEAVARGDEDAARHYERWLDDPARTPDGRLVDSIDGFIPLDAEPPF